MMKKLFAVWFFLALGVYGAEVKTVSVDFTKIQTRSGSTADTVTGTLYTFDNRMVIRIRSPILQYMLFDSLRTRIYNPGERAGVELHLKSRSFLPFFQTFIGFLQGGDQPPQVNFRIAESVKRGDSLITRWIPEEKKTSFKGSLEMVYFKDRPVRTTTFDKKKQVLGQMQFLQDTVIDNRHVPRRIVAITPAEGGQDREEVVFSNAAAGKPVPVEIRDYKVPADIRLKVIEW